MLAKKQKLLLRSVILEKLLLFFFFSLFDGYSRFERLETFVNKEKRLIQAGESDRRSSRIDHMPCFLLSYVFLISKSA